MAKLFLGLAIAVMLAAAVLGFLAKGNIDKLQSEYKGAKQAFDQAKASERKAVSDAKKSMEDLTAANSKLEQQMPQINALRTKAEELDSSLKVANAELIRLKSETGQPKGIGPDSSAKVEELTAQVEQLRSELTKAQTDANEKIQMVETLTNSNRQKEEQLATAQSEVNRYKKGFARNGLSGRVSAVNSGYGFVVLNVGDKQGAATGSMMIVTRNGEPIGKVRITSVEPSISIADILPGSFRKGVSVQPGDVAVYEGSRAQPNTLGAPAPGVALPQP